ncbi:uncharacterized protein LOC129976071 isoform X2 [Argiope bruennichi]|uniref:uncharacterized protein LOC129976071 isoform X2 n=1 Tax=Argiope bruennichi TaxID=94029 RepID=UPI0024957A1B|nr:uncharacterized protein LOC129976071 isoform X2 [Argiope bruennichi]
MLDDKENFALQEEDSSLCSYQYLQCLIKKNSLLEALSLLWDSLPPSLKKGKTRVTKREALSIILKNIRKLPNLLNKCDSLLEDNKLKDNKLKELELEYESLLDEKELLTNTETFLSKERARYAKKVAEAEKKISNYQRTFKRIKSLVFELDLELNSRNSHNSRTLGEENHFIHFGNRRRARRLILRLKRLVNTISSWNSDICSKDGHSVPFLREKETRKVCERHFKDGEVLYRTIFYNESTGDTLSSPLKKSRLKENAVLSIFPGCPTYLLSST